MPWIQYFPPSVIKHNRPTGVVAIYKRVAIVKIYNDSFSNLVKEARPKLAEGSVWKFVKVFLTGDTFKEHLSYDSFLQELTKPISYLGFQLSSKRGDGVLELKTQPDNSFTFQLKQLLTDIKYQFFDRTCYFDVHVAENKMYYIALDKPSFVCKKQGSYEKLE